MRTIHNFEQSGSCCGSIKLGIKHYYCRVCQFCVQPGCDWCDSNYHYADIMPEPKTQKAKGMRALRLEFILFQDLQHSDANFALYNKMVHL